MNCKMAWKWHMSALLKASVPIHSSRKRRCRSVLMGSTRARRCGNGPLVPLYGPLRLRTVAARPAHADIRAMVINCLKREVSWSWRKSRLRAPSGASEAGFSAECSCEQIDSVTGIIDRVQSRAAGAAARYPAAG